MQDSSESDGRAGNACCGSTSATPGSQPTARSRTSGRDWSQGSVRLPRIGWVKMREELRFAGDITTVVVRNDGIRWYVLIGVDTVVVAPPKRTGESVGIDMGVRILATLSDGTVVENPKALSSALAVLRRVDKVIACSKDTQGHNRQSNRREKLYGRRRRLHARVAATGSRNSRWRCKSIAAMCAVL
ncbi:MAG: transposase [Chloroflexi bacterium]|nr:transposase [Chloroflexota bacterium]